MNNFQRDMARSQRRFNFMFRLIAGFVFLMFIATLTFYVFVGKMVLETDWSGGVKPVIEKVWCGEVGCTESKPEQ